MAQKKLKQTGCFLNNFSDLKHWRLQRGALAVLALFMLFSVLLNGCKGKIQVRESKAHLQ